MNTYELEIYLNQKDQHFVFEEPIHHYVDCEEYVLEGHLSNITSKGFFMENNNNRVWIPGHRVLFIIVKFLEKIQTVPDVTESIKAALTEE